jgi:signal transduction histidine kinase
MQSALNSASTVLNKVLGRGSEAESDSHESALGLRVELQDLYAKLGERLDEATTQQFGLAMHHADVLSEAFAALLRPVEQALKITREISEYSLIGRARPGHEVCPMIPLIQSIHEELQPLIEQNQIHVLFDLHGPLQLYGAELHYRAAIRNLLINACDALAELGDDRQRRIFLRYHSVPAGALISVEDNGDGIPDDVRQRLYEPFFSTKGRSHTGLGLPIVRKVATLYDGQLDIDSRPGEGTRARILLPLKQVAPVR